MLAKSIRIIIVCCLWLGMIMQAAPALAQSQPAGGYVDRAGGDDNHIEVTLHADRAPAAGEVATLTMTATPQVAAPDLLFEWLVPEGVELLGGPATEAIGAVAAGQTVAKVRQIRVPGPGVYKVMARSGYRYEPALNFSALGVLFFTVNEDGTSTASDQDPNAKNFDRTVKTEVLPGVTTAALRAPNDDPCFYITGRITRWDRAAVPTPSFMYAAPVEVPLRFVRVAIREEDDFFDDTYWEGTTNANGEFAHNFCDDDGFLNDELEIYIQIYAEIDFNGSDVVSVEDDGLIDDLWEFESEVWESEGGAHAFNLQMKDNEQSAIMNIADAIFDAWTVWNNSGGAKGDDAIFDGETEIHYEPGDGATGSFYNGYFLTGSNILNNDDITIADDPSDPDPWDDSVIMHEWGHMADDYYGCDDNAGGPHNLDQLVGDLELSWGEGYPDYYQSAVKGALNLPNASFYMDVDGSGTGGLNVDLETYDNTRAVGAMRPDLLTEFNEMAIAAMLWDLNDNNNDPRTPGTPPGGPFDTVSHGHRPIQEVYTDPFFESNGDWADDTCTSFVYLWSWLKLGKPTDSATAEAVTKNIRRPNPFFGGRSFAAMTAALEPTTAAAPTSIFDINVNDNPNQIDPRWWQRLTFVVDNSASMAQSDKFGAVKTVLKETVNDALNANPKGIAVNVQTFNNGSPFNQNVLEGQFRTDGIYPFVDQMATVGTEDIPCFTPNDPMNALRQGAIGQTRGQLWLYTDTDGSFTNQGLIRAQLNQQQMRASIALLGGCSSSGRIQSSLTGEEEDFLMLAADGSHGHGIVPYLLTALGTGGQFLYVNQAQLADASDILRAQLANSAGAGKWSDYVSDVFTYRWDRLEPSEYLWVTGLANQGPLGDSGGKRITVPDNVFFWGGETGAVDVYQNGYIYMNPCIVDPQFCLFGINDYADILRKPDATPLEWYYQDPGPRAASTESPDATDQFVNGWNVWVYTGQYQDWFVISTEGYSGVSPYPRRAYQVWFNLQTGEVRYLYDQITPEDSGNARIAVTEDFLLSGTTYEVVVSNQDLAGAVSGNGYKFTPAPPVETRTYAVKADSLIERIGFLQTGYSGAFQPMVVTDPNGAAVTCGGDVTCYTVDHNAGDRMVQYIEVPNTIPGTWNATIDGASEQATFTFNALAASDLNADSPSKRLRPSSSAAPLIVQLGQAVDGNTLTGWFQSPNGSRFSGDFTLYDDGTHGDGRAGDGRFGLPDFNSFGRGVAYLWVKGQVDGEDFERADPVPFNFQPLRVTALNPEVSNNNEAVDITFQVDNLSSSAYCFDGVVTLPEGWSAAWNTGSCPNIAAGGSANIVLTVTPSWADAPSGQTGEVRVHFFEQREGAIQADAFTTFVRRRPPAIVEFDERAENLEIEPDSAKPVPVVVSAADEQGYPVADGTLVEVSVAEGTIAPVAAASGGAGVAAVSDQATIELTNGRAEMIFTPPTTEGDVAASATLGVLTDTITLHVVGATANHIDLAATPTNLFDGPTSSELVVTVKSEAGNPIVDALVRVGVSDDDGTQGTISGSMVITGTTDANGQLKATFTKSEGAAGSTYVRAELLLDEGGVVDVKQTDQVQIFFEEPVAPLTSGVKLPFIRRQ